MFHHKLSRQDFYEVLRQKLIPPLGYIVQGINELTRGGFYVTSETDSTEFVGRVEMSEEEFEIKLQEMGFERNPLAALKRLKSDPLEKEEGSFRKVDFEDYPRKQLHVICYDGKHINNAESGYTYVYAHWEFRWDTDPIRHYQGAGTMHDAIGVKRMKALLDEANIRYTDDRP